MNDVDLNVTKATVYRAKRDFKYTDEVTIKRGEIFNPTGARNDDKIIAHFCYPEEITAADLLNQENSVESDEGAASKGATTTKRRGRTAKADK